MQIGGDHRAGFSRPLHRALPRGVARHRDRLDGEILAHRFARKNHRPLSAALRRLWLYGGISDLAHVPGCTGDAHLCRHERDHEASDCAQPVKACGWMQSSSTPSVSVAGSAAPGIGLMLAGITLFSINDALGKWLLGTYSVGELRLVRSAAALILIAPFVRQAGIAAFTAAPMPGLQIVRVALATLEVAMFFWAVSYLPLADTVTFYLAGPIYVTALSVVLLREPVGWRRWTAVLVGFGGVVLALRPSAASFTLPALIALTGSMCFAASLVTTRMLRATSNTVLVAGQIAATLLFGAV